MKILKLAIQKSGRLSERSLQMLKECDMRMPNGIPSLKTKVSGFPMELLFLRDDDIPEYVEDGVVDAGIVGENVVVESQCDIDITERLDFAHCRLSLAIPKSESYNGPQYFQKKRIATSYPVLLQTFLIANNISASIHTINGSVEIAPGIGLADGICDLVSTGSTLFNNGLKEVETVFRSEAVLVVGKSISSEKRKLLNQLNDRINAVKAAGSNKYVLLNAPDEKLDAIINLIPGMKSPTVMPLAMKGWSSVHSVFDTSSFWDKIDKLKNLGAQGILVIPIEKMIV